MLKTVTNIVNVSQITGVLPVVNGGTGVTTSTGTGSTVLSAAPTLSGNVTLSTGNLIVDSGQGIDFSADPSAAGMTSELFDDYEEGTFTPVYNTSDNNLTGFSPYSGNFGRYTKVGRICHIHIEIATVSAASIAGTGFVIVAGLPFSADKVNIMGVAMTVMDSYARWTNPPTLGLINTAYGTTDTQIILFRSTGTPSDVADFNPTNSNLFNTTTINFTYQVA